jgi:hypothetical protein
MDATTVSRSFRECVRLLIVLIASAATAFVNPAQAQAQCIVTDPTGTPLNVRTEPQHGEIIGTLKNGS